MKRMSDLRDIFVLFALFVLVSSFSASDVWAFDIKDAAVSAVDEADGAIVEAFGAVLEAEKAGANVSRLLTRLNVAGEYLTRAHEALKKGDFAGVVDDANRGREIADEVKTDAGELKKLAPHERQQHLLFWLILSTIAICGIGIGSVISWHVFKRRYNRRILEAEPKVDEHGSQGIS